MKRLIGLVAFAAASLASGAQAAGPVVGQLAPDFTVQTLDGRTVTLESLRGNVVVVNFWATWCGPCKRELPILDRFYELRRDVGLRVLAVTTEDSLPLARLKPLAERMTIPMVRRFKGRYGVLGGVPTNYVIDRAGVLRYAKAAAFDLDDLNALLVPLLQEPAPPARMTSASR